MIVKEQFYVGERLFNRVYSDSGKYVVRDGVEYSEACDPAEFEREYTEGGYMPAEDQEAGVDSFLNTILTDGLVSMPTEDEPDYLNENEAEPNYFKGD